MDHIDSKSMQPSETLGLLANFKKLLAFLPAFEGNHHGQRPNHQNTDIGCPRRPGGSFFPRQGRKKNHNREPGLFVWVCIFHNLVQEQLRILLLQKV